MNQRREATAWRTRPRPWRRRNSRAFFRAPPLLYSLASMELISPLDYTKESVLAVQDYSVLAWRSIANLFSQPRYFADTLMQADLIGVGSLPIVVLTGFIT